MHPEEINIEDYNYHLPQEMIALRPLALRDESRLIVYRNGEITTGSYANIAPLLPGNSTLVFNDTRVVNARIVFKKESGAKIEVFCLEPTSAAAGFEKVFSSTGSSEWKCFVGGASKWKGGDLELKLNHKNKELTLRATLKEKRDGYYILLFSWTPDHLPFGEVIQLAGSVPLPPYIKREAEESDRVRYQTLFAKNEGSVAAPTAALHFTDNIIHDLSQAAIGMENITLHVGAGTFRPVNADKLAGHEMHAEWIDVPLKTIESIADKEFIVPVGTTSLRTLESMYWMGVKIMRGDHHLHISQWEVYNDVNENCNVPVKSAYESLTAWMRSKGMERLFTQTSILIAPGYKMRVAKALITNFHQPKSTLLLLVASAIGDDWKSVYTYALEHNFRFLSYGDGSLLFFPQG
ncbi:MAG: S-adenosylmethionine:tRNA ribosyltransferase-isomerase [Chitinophagaceae bacterium]|nr:MAG: S-adenosylmethionine:tRNA ribosyltransferase-isomerase [Chitinophagaceae bacterium]